MNYYQHVKKWKFVLVVARLRKPNNLRALRWEWGRLDDAAAKVLPMYPRIQLGARMER
jgi:hypothetical protein